MKKKLNITLALAFIMTSIWIFPKHSDAQDLTKKWFPGHYVAIRHLTSPINESGRDLVKDNTYITGYKVHVVWNELEPVKDQYDFTVIRSIIKIAETDNKKLLIHIQDRLFGKNGNPYLPDYMLTDEYEGGWYNSAVSGASYGKVWLASYQERWNKLLQAIAEEVNTNQTVAGIIVSESSMNTKDAAGYDKEGHLSFITSMHSTMAKFAPETIFFQYVNWGFTEEEREMLMKYIVEVCHSGFGGPDIYDGKRPEENRTWTLDMKFGSYYKKYRGMAAFSVENQSGGYKEPASAQQVFEYAVDQIGVHFLPWTIYTGTDRSYNFVNDVLPLINKEKGRINSTPPSNLIRTGVSEIKQSKSGTYSVCPNPASDQVVLTINSEYPDGSHSCELLDITGKLIGSELNINSALTIPTSQLEKGTYFLRVRDKNLKSETFKFIKI